MCVKKGQTYCKEAHIEIIMNKKTNEQTKTKQYLGYVTILR